MESFNKERSSIVLKIYGIFINSAKIDMKIFNNPILINIFSKLSIKVSSFRLMLKQRVF